MKWPLRSACPRRQRPACPRRPCAMRGTLWAVLCGCLMACVLPAAGQSPAGQPFLLGQTAWEYRPYQIAVWLVFDGGSPHAAGILGELTDWLPRRSEAVLGAAWQMEVQEAPAKLASRPDLAEMPFLTWENLFSDASAESGEAELGDVEAKDKVFLVRLTNVGGMTEVFVREIDVRTRQVGPPIQGHSACRATLPLAVWDALMAGFSPLARIERVDDQEVTARLRAGGLWISPMAAREPSGGESSSEVSTQQEFPPPWLAEGAAFRPILRRNQRDGRPEPGGIQPLAWTLLEVRQREGLLLRCRLHSAFRSSLPPRGSARLERLALAVQPTAPSTTLVLQSRGEGRPLVGYELYLARDAAGDLKEADGNASQAGGPSADVRQVGVTDERGQVTIAGGERRVKNLLVRHGQQLLARLPVVGGQPGPLVVELPNDDPRLVAEALAQAVTVRSLDLVALREVFAARLRAQAKAGQPEEARQLLEAFRRLPSRADLTRELERFRQQISSPDRLTQARIDRVFVEAQKVLLQRPLSDELVTELARELASAGR